MTGGESSFTKQHQELYAWAQGTLGASNVMCTACNTVLSVKNGGYVLKRHNELAKHRTNEENQAKSSQKVLNFSKKKVVVAQTELIQYAEFLHCLNIIVNNMSFRSSELFKRKEQIYKDMFPDSAIAGKVCIGETKVSYLIKYGIFPPIKELLKAEFNRNEIFGLHIDECSKYDKSKLEFFITTIDNDGNRISKFLSSKELHLDIDCIKNAIEKKDTLKMKSILCGTIQGASDIVNATAEVFKENPHIDPELCVYSMTDNCSTMIGKDGGFVKKLKEEVCKNIVGFPGCGTHQLNTAVKTLQSGPLAETFSQVKKLCTYLSEQKKVSDALGLAEKILGFKKIAKNAPTRFLSMSQVLESVCDQFEVVIKFVINVHNRY